MRRNTSGVFAATDLQARIARAEREDAARVVARLEPLVGEARRQRLLEVIARRLGSVAVVFDAPYDPHNGAAVVRSCEAFGVQALHVVERVKTPFLVSGAVARGTEKWIDLVRHPTPEGAIAAARAGGFEMVAARADGELLPRDLSGVARVAIVVGNEREGIRPELAAACARSVRVPMRGFADSLNVSVTAAILLHAATDGRAGDLSGEDRMRLYARGLYLSVPHADEVLR